MMLFAASNDGSGSGGRGGGDNGARRNLKTTIEAAAYLRLSPRTLEDYRCEGGGPEFFRIGRGRRRKVLYDLYDLNVWLDRQKKQ